MITVPPQQNAELGQVWTPPDIALEMVEQCLLHDPSLKSVLDPACGPGTFSQAFHAAKALDIKLDCFDIDTYMVKATSQLNRKLGLSGKVQSRNYLLETQLKNRYDLVIMNPPYIRQEHISAEAKDAYHSYITNTLDCKIDRRANLFVFFLLKGLIDLVPGGLICAIVYDAVSQTGYGKQLLKVMKKHAELISNKHISAPFDNALVDAQILLYKKRHQPLISDDDLSSSHSDGLISLSELLDTRRGTGLPLRKLFIADEKDPYFDKSEPFFVKQGRLSSLIIRPDQRAYLIKSDKDQYKSQILNWLQKRAGNLSRSNAKLIVSAVKGPIAFNYYIRNAARHLWNPENVAISDNFYVSDIKGDFPKPAAWLLLNSKPYLSKILASARNQGNGLSKLQLYEYKNIRVPDWRSLSTIHVESLVNTSLDLISNDANYEKVRLAADIATKDLFDA